MNTNSDLNQPKITCQVDDKPQEPITCLRRGDLCPQCKQGRMDYDGLLNLYCPQCGYTYSGGGGFT